VAWCCLAEDEIVEFKTWALTTFPSVQIVTVADPSVIIECPPPPVQGDVTALLEDIRETLRARAPQWFVPATPTGVMKLVA
jgi:hypothetical protein